MARVGEFSVIVPQGVERESGYVRLVHGTPYAPQLRSHCPYPADAEVTVDGRPVGVFRVEARGSVTVETPPDDAGRGRLTFYAAATEEGAAAGGGAVAADDRGLLKVVFRPGKTYRPAYDLNDPDRFRKAMEAAGRRAGGWLGGDNEPRWGVLRSMGPPPRATVGDAVTHVPMNTAFASVTTDSGRLMYGAAEAGPGPDAAAGVTGLSGTSDQRWHAAPPVEYLPDREVTITLRLVAVPKEQAVRPLPPPPPRANAVPPPVEA